MTDELREPCIHGQREYQGETCHDCDLDRMAAQYEKELAEKDRRISELEKAVAEEKELKLWHQGIARKERGELEALRAKNAELEAELASLRAERITVEKMDTAVKDQIDRLEAQNTALVAERDKMNELVESVLAYKFAHDVKDESASYLHDRMLSTAARFREVYGGSK